MNPYQAYQQNRDAGQPRIDTILALFEHIFARLEKARAALRSQDLAGAREQLAACQLGISGLAGGFDARGGELAINLLRLYEFAGRCLGSGTEAGIESALRALRPLQKGFQDIRVQAVQMERTGDIPPLKQACMFQATA